MNFQSGLIFIVIFLVEPGVENLSGHLGELGSGLFVQLHNLFGVCDHLVLGALPSVQLF